MRIKTIDSDVFEGQDAKDIVRQMNRVNWNAPERKGDYMQSVAIKVWAMTHYRMAAPMMPPTTKADTFLAELADLGLIEILPDSTLARPVAS